MTGPPDADGEAVPAGDLGSEPPVLVVAAALVDDLAAPRRLLAARRQTPERLRGKWEFPGGKLDHGESTEHALRRELREELGVEVVLGSELVGPDDGTWRISHRHVMRLWLAVVSTGDPRPLVEHDELRWLEQGAWLSVDWLDADVRIVRELIRQVAAVGFSEA